MRPTAVPAAIALASVLVAPAIAQDVASAPSPAADRAAVQAAATPAAEQPVWREWYACAAMMERTLPLTDNLLEQLRTLAKTDAEAAAMLPAFEKEWTEARPLVPRAAAELFAAGDRSLAQDYDTWARDRSPAPPARDTLAEQDKAAARAAYAQADVEAVHAGMQQHRCEALVRAERAKQPS